MDQSNRCSVLECRVILALHFHGQLGLEQVLRDVKHAWKGKPLDVQWNKTKVSDDEKNGDVKTTTMPRVCVCGERESKWEKKEVRGEDSQTSGQPGGETTGQTGESWRDD